MVKAEDQTSGNLIGDTLEFKGDSYITPSFDPTKKTITYTAKVATSIGDTTESSKLVTAEAVKNYVTNQTSTYGSILGLEADNTETATSQPKGSVNLKTGVLKVKGDSNIETSVENTKDTINIKLKDSLTEITSIESKDNGGKNLR